MPFLPPVEIKVGFICKEGLDVFLDRKKRSTRELSVLPLSDAESHMDMGRLNILWYNMSLSFLSQTIGRSLKNTHLIQC